MDELYISWRPTSTSLIPLKDHDMLGATRRIRQISLLYGVLLDPLFELDDFPTLPRDLIEKVVNHLMTKFCFVLDHRAEEMSTLMMPVLRLFLEINVPKVIDLTAFMSFCPKSHKAFFYREALIEISKMAPQVEEVMWYQHVPTNRFESRILMDIEIFEALANLNKLTTLTIMKTFEFRLLDLIRLGHFLPNLQSLSITLADEFRLVGPAGRDLQIDNELQKSFQNLNMFIFETHNPLDEISSYQYFKVHLPKVHIIGSNNDKCRNCVEPFHSFSKAFQ